jgi:hypothetical protein
LNPSELPIVSLRADLARVMKSQSCVVIQAPTGSGKSTQVPQFMLDDGLAGRDASLCCNRGGWRRDCWRSAWRRNAARSLAAKSGFQYRLENVSSRETRILYVTEGILAAPDAGKRDAARRERPRLRRISRAASRGRSRPGPRAADPADGAARSQDHRHVGHAGDGAAERLSQAGGSARVAGQDVSGHARVSAQAERSARVGTRRRGLRALLNSANARGRHSHLHAGRVRNFSARSTRCAVPQRRDFAFTRCMANFRPPSRTPP